MASRVQDKSGNFLVAFRWGGRQYTRSLHTRDRRLADVAVRRVNETLMRLKLGWLVMPEDAEPGTFILTGGVHASPPGRPDNTGSRRER